MSIWDSTRCLLALDEIKRWHGTPHHDRMAEPGVGVDCLFLLRAILIASNVLPQFEMPYYDTTEGMHGASTRLRQTLLECCHSRIADKHTPQFGDVAVFKTGQSSGHGAFVFAEDGGKFEMVHALGGRCVTVSDYQAWKMRVECLIRFDATGFKRQPETIWRDLRE